MLGMNDLRAGVVFKKDGEPYLILSSNFLRMAQRKPVRQAKVKNLISGKVLELSFKLDDRFEEADIQRVKASYLYHDDATATFMDSETFDQVSVELANVDAFVHFLTEGAEVALLMFEAKPISIEMPKKVELKVTETVGATRGDTAQGSVMKDATLESGYSLKVPLFVKEGDMIRINTDTGEYVERV